jgi:hypothetical protein
MTRPVAHFRLLELEHFQEKACPREGDAKAGVDTGFPSENATNAKTLERFCYRSL